MIISYSLLLIPYAFFLVVFGIFTIINIYNLIRFGGWNIVGFWATFLFLAGVVFIFFISYQNLIIFDWQETVTILERSDFLPQPF
ncbi:MAG: hypothetical protein HQ536_03460 [Parcubacteria group bacterium]|nr:hypothetical protein [Parcubacteria group bacterium]